MTDLAVFDLDYTLTQKGTWGRFVTEAMRDRPVGAPAMWLNAGWMQLKYRRGKVPRIAVKQAMMQRSITGWSRDRLSELAEEFVARDVEGGLDPRVVTALRAHQSAGDVVLIASAAVCILVERYADALGADGFVSTEFGWDGDQLSHNFASKNCYGPEKLLRVQGWLRERGLTPARVTAYSDSCADAALLEWTDRAVMVRPKSKARKYADGRGFEIWS